VNLFSGWTAKRLGMHHEAEPDEELRAPAQFAEALRRASKVSVFVPGTVDETILKAAQRHLTRNLRRRSPWIWWLSSLTGAVTVVVVLALASGHFHTAGRLRAGAEDVNGDGQVDILDAFALARQMKGGGDLGAKFDVNGDGKVDEGDVATLATKAVQLERGGRS
jgi:hypothetical protein